MQLYINFVDFEKAFDRIHRDSLWHIVRAYGIPLHIVQIIKCFYHNFTCSMESSSLNINAQQKTGQEGSDGRSLIRLRTLTSPTTLCCYITCINTCKRRHDISASLVNR